MLCIQRRLLLVTLCSVLTLDYTDGTRSTRKPGGLDIYVVRRNETLLKEGTDTYQNSEGQEYQTELFDDFSSENTFPDIEYAFLGYNIFKGYPLAFGHDPGFSLPIFRAEHSIENKSPDFRYNIPKGYVLIPDVACSTSFSSSIIKTKHEFHKSLSTKVSFNGGGLGFEFAASTEYQESSDVLSSKKYVLIHSSAHCHNYFAKMISIDPPPFSHHFKKWLRKLNNSDTQQVYFDFFENYGTHFIKEITLGSSLTFEHKMSTTSYESFKKNKINVEASASYSGLFSIGGSFHLDKSQSSSVSDFQKKVTTRSITAGATPSSNGNVMEWASVVKKNPVPVKYKLSPIYELFQSEFMSDIGINYQTIGAKVQKHSTPYFKHLYDQGYVNDFYDLIEFYNIRFMFAESKNDHFMKKVSAISTDQCKQKCLEWQDCVAAYFVENVDKSDVWHFHTCNIFVVGEPDTIRLVAEIMNGSTTFVITSRIRYEKDSWNKAFMLLNGKIRGNSDINYMTTARFEDCYNTCYNTTVQCAGMTWDYTTNSCRMFRANDIVSVDRQNLSYSCFLPPRKERTMSRE